MNKKKFGQNKDQILQIITRYHSTATPIYKNIKLRLDKIPMMIEQKINPSKKRTVSITQSYIELELQYLSDAISEVQMSLSDPDNKSLRDHLYQIHILVSEDRQ